MRISLHIEDPSLVMDRLIQLNCASVLAPVHSRHITSSVATTLICGPGPSHSSPATEKSSATCAAAVATTATTAQNVRDQIQNCHDYLWVADQSEMDRF